VINLEIRPNDINLLLMRVALFITTVFFLVFTEKANAFVWSFGGEKFVKVEDLPDTDEWRDDAGIYQDAYVIYKHGWILWIPVWNWDARYVLSSGGGVYYEFANESDVARLTSKYGPPTKAIPFWENIGGKILWGFVILIWAFFKFGSSAITSLGNAGQQTAYIHPSPQIGLPKEILISREGHQYGPYSSEQARTMLSSGELSESDQAWYQGAEGWMPLGQVPGIR